MDYFKRLIANGAIHTVIISIVFFVYARLLGIAYLSISMSRYFLIIAMGLLISAAGFIFNVKALHIVLKYLIHFASLFLTFIFVFLNVNSERITTGFIFSALVIFTISYLMIVAAMHLYKQSFGENKRTKKQKKKQ